MKQHFGKYLGPTLIDEGEPLTAWRTWRLGQRRIDKQDALRLTGTWASKFEWVPRGVTVAECLATGKKKGCNLTMEPGCNCGLWGSVALTNLLKHGAVGLFPVGVLGRAHLWGFVHVYEFGFRASMGRPVECWLGNSTGERARAGLSAEYKIQVHLGLPTEIIDPHLLPPKKVTTAAALYQRAPAPTISASRKEIHRCSGCNTPHRRRDTCPTCTATSLPAAVGQS